MEYNAYKDIGDIFETDPRPIASDDIPFFNELSKSVNGDVLELGCGAGRLALVMAKNQNVTGIDMSDSMLNRFREKIKDLDSSSKKIELIKGDITNFSLNRKFALIVYSYRLFQVLLTDEAIKNSLACAKKHMDEDSILFLNTVHQNTKNSDWMYFEEKQYETPIQGGRIARYWHTDSIDFNKQWIYSHHRYEINIDGKIYEKTNPMAHRYYFPEQLEKTIDENGFKILSSYGYYDKRPMDKDNPRELIYLVKLK